MRGLQRGGLAGRKPLSLHCGSATTAAVERRIAALFRAATAGLRSTATVYGRGPGMPLHATEGDTVLLPPRKGGGFHLSSFFSPPSVIPTEGAKRASGGISSFIIPEVPRLQPSASPFRCPGRVGGFRLSSFRRGTPIRHRSPGLR